MRARVPKHRGFTLVELLVAILILTLFMTASMGAVRTASRSWAAGQERTDRTEEMRSIAGFLRRQFAQAPILRVGEGDNERIAFIADDRHVRFVAPAPQYAHGPGLITYQLAVDTIDDKAALTLIYAPFDPGAARFDEPLAGERVVLALDFDDIRFEYFGTETDKGVVSWRESWSPDADFYPRAIRILSRADGATSGWPDLVFALRSGEQP